MAKKTTNKTFNRSDAALEVSLAIPAAAANGQTAALDLESGAGNCELLLSVPALANLASTKTVSAKIQESADNATFVDAAWAPALTITGEASGGGKAGELRLAIPSNAKRYVRAYVATAADGGNNTASKLTLSAKF